jgi:acetoin utilization protein AcuB
MYVGRIMKTNLITVSPDTTIVEAKDIIEKNSIEHLLVVNPKGDLIGIISDRDIKQSWASPASSFSSNELTYLLDKMTVDMIMKKNVITIPPNITIERAARIIQENRIGSLPVIEDGKLRGIITRTDVMGVLLDAIGISDESKRISVLVKDRVGCLHEITEILDSKKVNIQSLFSWPEKKFPGVFQLVMRIPASDSETTIAALEENKFKVLTGYIEDISSLVAEI